MKIRQHPDPTYHESAWWDKRAKRRSKTKILRHVPLTVEQMRGMLKDVTWKVFAKTGCYDVSGCVFRARLGIFMGRRVLAIIAKGQFISITNYNFFTYHQQGNLPKSFTIDPKRPRKTGINFHNGYGTANHPLLNEHSYVIQPE